MTAASRRIGNVSDQTQSDAGALGLDEGHRLGVGHTVGGSAVDGKDAIPNLWKKATEMMECDNSNPRID